MDGIIIRPLGENEVDDFVRAEGPAWGTQVDDKVLDLGRLWMERPRARVAVHGERFVGGIGLLSLTLGVPGGALPCAGVTFVWTAPTHRRRGVLTRLMRDRLESLRDGAEPIAALLASESCIYSRFGFGPASWTAAVTIERRASQEAWPLADDGRLEPATLDDVLRLLPPVHDALAARTNGMPSRTPAMWRVVHHEAQRYPDDSGADIYVVHRDAVGAVDGYAAYRLLDRWEDGVSRARMRVVELLAATPRADAALWRHVLDMDLVDVVEARRRPLEEPVLHRLADPRRWRRVVTDDLHLRVLDVERALAGRRYACDGEVRLELRDAVCPWTEGTYLLKGGPDGARCTRTGGDADVALDASVLGAVYLGDTSLTALHLAGRVEERTPGAVARLARMLAWPQRPWCPQEF